MDSNNLLHPTAQALIFDMDGTIIDSIEINWQAMDVALRNYDIIIQREEFVSLTGRSLEEIVQLIVKKYAPNRNIDVQDIVEQKRQYANAHAETVKEIPLIANIARQCYGRLPMAIGTGSDKNRAQLMLKSTNLLHLFDHIVASEDVQNHKPHPDTFLRCAQLMGVAPQHCQVFEDGDTGLQAARTAGMIATDVRPYI